MSIEDLRGEVERLRRRESELVAEVARLRTGREPDAPSTASEAGVGTLRPDLLFTAADKTRMAMIVTDPNLPDNPIVFANRAFLEMSGYAAGELFGRNCRFLQGPETDPAQVARVREAIAARRDVVVEVLNYWRDGSTFVNELYVSPVFGPHGELLFFFGSQLDLTRFRESEGRAARQSASFYSLPENGEAGFCIVEVCFDVEGRADDYRFIEVNAAFELEPGVLEMQPRDSYGEFAKGLYAFVAQPFYRPIGAPAEVLDGERDETVNETIDASVFERWRADRTYRPQNLTDWGRRYGVEPGALTDTVFAQDPQTVVPESTKAEIHAP